MSEPLTNVTNKAITTGIIIGVSLAVYIVVGYLIRKLIRRAVTVSSPVEVIDSYAEKKRKDTLIGIFNAIWKVLVSVIATTITFRNLFPLIDLSPLWASASIIGVALGFGAQSIVRDLLSGLFIISENQYRVGDIVEINEAVGEVEKLGTRSTVIRDLDGNVHYIPNGTIMHVINKTMGYGVTRFAIAVDPSADIEKVIEIINITGQEIAEAKKWSNKILDAPQFSNIGDITGASITIIITGKTLPSEQWSVTAEMRRRLLIEFDKSGIKLSPTSATK